ncbi:ATP-binding cassette domain-containing protein [Marinilabilia salmonicolor]|jgi:ABC-type lipoprotein export system ATPase subunit|uniref:ABC transporter family protein n=1 Tax=Marinilabilia salmonicolor TaxID=989 RepID=A0A368UJ39_9BACT|nr:ATP-binding cassette domain-containing protein [Marinilabilia salmonicolor]RCW26102.1 ABC transporter family protein [Marinilabilia salmonicolor]
MVKIECISIIGGIDKFGKPENITSLDIREGEIIGIAGPTGSGKSQLISDIEQLSQKDSSRRRQVLVNGKVPSPALRNDPRQKQAPAQCAFLGLHPLCRRKTNR